jgi:hypothetical protein
MWSIMDSDLVEIARICKLKWHTPLSGCYNATCNFSLQIVGEFSSDGNIPIVGTLDVDINAS